MEEIRSTSLSEINHCKCIIRDVYTWSRMLSRYIPYEFQLEKSLYVCVHTCVHFNLRNYLINIFLNRYIRLKFQRRRHIHCIEIVSVNLNHHFLIWKYLYSLFTSTHDAKLPVLASLDLFWLSCTLQYTCMYIWSYAYERTVSSWEKFSARGVSCHCCDCNTIFFFKGDVYGNICSLRLCANQICKHMYACIYACNSR